MNQRHIYAIAKKEWLHIIRDPMTIFLLAIGPVLMLLLISYAMATDITDVPTVIYDQDQSDLSANLVTQLDASDVLNVTDHVNNTTGYEDQLEQRKARLVVIIEDGFSDQLTTTQGLESIATSAPRFSFVIDGTDPLSAETALETAVNISGQFVRNQLNTLVEQPQTETAMLPEQRQRLRQQLRAPVDIHTTNRFNPDLKAIWDLVPAMIAVALVLPGMSISTVIARERSQGTLETLVATPISKHAILMGKAFPYVLIALLNVVLMYIVARAVFGVPFRGNLLVYFALSGLYVLATLAIGLLFSILIKSIEAALWASMMFFLFPGMLLSGMFFPVDVFPFIVKLETLELPVVSGVLINRGMFLQGVSVKDLWWNILLLLIIAVEGFEIAGRLFKKRIA